MGKWTHSYTDDVLHAKVSALVTGAIRRSAAENPGALPPTYNEFVHELDTGDSFTTTMLDILVKEVMERRKRPAGDRRLISDKTAKSLRHLSGTLNIYHGRPARMTTARYTPITSRLSSSREPFYVDTDDDDFDSLIHESSSDPNPAEGSHMSSAELFEAMSTRANPPPVVVPSEPTNVPPPPLVLPPRSGRASPWTVLPATSTNPHTTRTISSNQPTSLRRTVPLVTTRGSREVIDWANSRRPPRIRASVGVLGSRRSIVASEDMVPELSTREETLSSQRRRYFGLNRLRRERAPATGLSEGSGDDEGSFMTGDAPMAGPSTSIVTSVPPPPLPQSWPEGSQIYVSPRAVMLRDFDSGATPTLRRGGVLPPETMFHIHYGPAPASPPSLDGIESVEPGLGEPAAYPTPGSVDNEQST
ncbi:hypothetical protein BKA70DRAFT_554169 [Coprinopsis sp. MPI-PUGE-AT-0042]|nr:hypothetical protein BKA70DRAFT_554169 [Coprinopsis sp. MPI-PUGE-AT-0042]